MPGGCHPVQQGCPRVDQDGSGSVHRFHTDRGRMVDSGALQARPACGRRAGPAVARYTERFPVVPGPLGGRRLQVAGRCSMHRALARHPWRLRAWSAPRDRSRVCGGGGPVGNARSIEHPMPHHCRCGATLSRRAGRRWSGWQHGPISTHPSGMRARAFPSRVPVPSRTTFHHPRTSTRSMWRWSRSTGSLADDPAQSEILYPWKGFQAPDGADGGDLVR